MNPPRPQAPIGPRALAPRMIVEVPFRLPSQRHGVGKSGAASGTQQYPIALQTGGLRGTVLVKTEDGQLQVVNVGTSASSSCAPAGETYRLSAVQSHGSGGQQHHGQQFSSSFMPPPPPVVGAMHQQRHSNLGIVASSITCRPQGQVMSHGMLPPVIKMPPPPTVPLNQPLSIQTTLATSHMVATTPSQMSPKTAKEKCKNFLSTLIRLARDQPKVTSSNVRCLIQGLIDGTIQPEEFTNQLEKELNSSPQRCLVPFLKKSLPYLRQSLLTKEITIDGVRPPVRAALPMSPVTAVPRNLKVQGGRSMLPRTAAQLQAMASGSIAAQLAGPGALQGVLAQQQQLVAKYPGVVALSRNKSLLLSKPSCSASFLSSAKGSAMPFRMLTPVMRSPISVGKQKRSMASQKIDDDISDVAAMGGVNLAEESQHILASGADVAGAEPRSCKDENFLLRIPLEKKIASLASKHGIEEVSADVAALVSHATEEHLKTLLEKLSAIAEHRQESMRTDSRYEVVQDVKGQLRFIEQLDKNEKRRHEDQEREMLLRVARSRAKTDDPEQLKLKQRALEVQRAAIEEVRLREVNMTALLAIGSRKRLKAECSAGSSAAEASANSGLASKMAMRSKVKRVNVKDVTFLLEQDISYCRSNLLYKTYFK